MKNKNHSSKIHPGLNHSPKINNIEKLGGLPNYIERIAKHIVADSGYTVSHAIASAVNRCKILAAKGNKEAIAALADWNTRIKGGKK